MKSKYFIPLYILFLVLCYFTSSYINDTYASSSYSVADSMCTGVYGEACVRVHNTSEFKNKIDDIFNNKKMGVFHFVWDDNEPVSFKDAYNYFFDKYGTSTSVNQYLYSKKGDQEPYRNKYSATDISETQRITDWELDTKSNIRISKEEKDYANQFVDKILPLITAGATSDYEKAYRVGKYINAVTRYKGDQVFQNDQGFVYNDTSIYDVFIERDSVCIGFSIAFAYMMDKLGIEAYIVDSASYNGQEYHSVHSYNKVKIGGTMYTVDITGSPSFGFNTSGMASYPNGNQIESIYNQYKGGISLNYKFYTPTPDSNIPDNPVVNPTTTTTKQVNRPTTTTREGETTQKTTYESEITYTPYPSDRTRVVEITNEAGEVVQTTVVYLGEDTTTPTTDEIVKGEEDKTNQTKLILNIVLITLAIIMVIVLVVLRLKDLGKIKCKWKDL